MKMKSLKISYLQSFLLSIFFIFTLNAFSQNIPPIKQFKLDNGLTVFLNEDHNKPIVYGAVVVKAGGKNDPSDATGMAHYQEHMLFKGTEELGTIDWEKEKPHIDKIFELYDKLCKTTDEVERKKIQTEINKESLEAGKYSIPNEFSNIVNSIGGTGMNAGTGPDITIYFNGFPPNQMEKWLEIYSHRFENPVFRSFQAELEVVYEEKNMYQDMFFNVLLEKFNEKFFKNHPYGQQTLIGTVDDLKNPSLTKMYKFYKTYYVPNNMALVISGDFKTEEIIPLIKKKFSSWKANELPEQKKYKEEPFNGREYVEMKLSPIGLGLLGFRTVPNGHPDELALKVCNRVLSNQSQTGLLDKLALDNKLMAVITVPFQFNDHGSTVFIVVPKLVVQKTAAAEELVMIEIEKLGKGEFDDSMIESIKLEYYKDFQLSMESAQRKVMMIGQTFAQNLDINEKLDYPNKIKAITKDDVVRVAKKYYGKNYLAFFSKIRTTDPC